MAVAVAATDRESAGWIPRPIVAAMRFTPFWKKLKAVAHTLPYDWAVMGDTMAGRPLSRDEWGRIEQPTLVMAGEKSPHELRQGGGTGRGAAGRPAPRPGGLSHNPKMKVLAPVLADFFAAPSEPRAASNR